MVCWGGAVWDRDVLFSLAGKRVSAGMVSGGGRSGLGHPIEWGWWGLKCREAFALSQKSCDSLKTACYCRLIPGHCWTPCRDDSSSKDLNIYSRLGYDVL